MHADCGAHKFNLIVKKTLTLDPVTVIVKNIKKLWYIFDIKFS